jgi:hypothetical protein
MTETQMRIEWTSVTDENESTKKNPRMELAIEGEEDAIELCEISAESGES